MTPSFSRRSFLVGAATAAGAAACSTGGKSPVIRVPSGNAGHQQGGQQLNLLMTAGPDFLSGVGQRLGMVLHGQTNFITPAPSSVTVQIGSDQQHYGPPQTAAVHSDAGTAPAYLTTTHQFIHPGTWWVRATYQGKGAEAPLNVIDPAKSLIPIPGQRMISTPTPTNNNQGVNPICTRNPACPWHDLSLDQALTQHRPIALLFATPALCQTATCGPVLDTLLGVAAQFQGRVRFLHSEIYTDLKAQTNTPAVLAYHLQSEPMLFLADAGGNVVERVDGLFGKGEAVAGLSRLVS